MLRSYSLPMFPLNLLIAELFKKETGVDLEDINSIDYVGRLSTCALMLIHGERDDRIPVSHSQCLYENAKEPKDLY